MSGYLSSVAARYLHESLGVSSALAITGMLIIGMLIIRMLIIGLAVLGAMSMALIEGRGSR